MKNIQIKENIAF